METKNDMPVWMAATDCKGCPYPSTGFLCGGSDGGCMKTRIQKIKDMTLRGESKRVYD